MTSETQMGILNRMDTLSEIDTSRQNYQRDFAGFKPEFKGMAQGYYPNTPWNIVKCILILFPAYIVCFFVFVAVTSWAISNSDQYAQFCFYLLLAYIAICTLVVYRGSFGRLKMERDCLAKRRREQLEAAARKKREREQAERLLQDYNRKL